MIQFDSDEAIEIEMEIRSAIADLDMEALTGLCDDGGMVGDAAREAFQAQGGTVNRHKEGGVIITETAYNPDEDDE